MPYITPTPEQLAALQGIDHTGPIWMLNLLRFNEGGAERYARYGDAVLPMVEKRGGKILFRAAARMTAIGPSDEQWDAMILVMYPSRDLFFEMLTSDEYQAIASLRNEALLDSRLVMTTELPLP